MRKILLTAALLNGAALALALAACKAPDGAGSSRANANAPAASAPAAAANQQAPAKPPADVVRRVTPNELKGMMERGEAVVVDVRGKEDYDRGHIKGAVLMPRGEAAARASELPKDKLIVFYCA